MKPENNLENKAAFFALYWGQEVIASDNHTAHGLKPLPVCGTIMRAIDIHQNCYLLLKSLSSISDDDAIEVAKMATHLHDKPSWSVRKIKDGKVWFEDNSISKISAFSDLFVKVGSFPLQGPFEYNEGIIKEHHFQFPLEAYDYLRSRGYALPWKGLSVDDLVEYGWVKLQEVEK